MYSKNANVFAAIPSLHAAYPLITVLYGSLSKRLWLHLLFVVFTLGVWFSAVYSRHHYVLDVLAGGLCAITAYLLYRFLSRRSPIDRLLDAYSKLIWIMMIVDFFVTFSCVGFFFCLWSDDPFNKQRTEYATVNLEVSLPFLVMNVDCNWCGFFSSPGFLAIKSKTTYASKREKSFKSSDLTSSSVSVENSSIVSLAHSITRIGTEMPWSQCFFNLLRTTSLAPGRPVILGQQIESIINHETENRCLTQIDDNRPVVLFYDSSLWSVHVGTQRKVHSRSSFSSSVLTIDPG